MSKKSALIVDDDEILRNGMRQILESMGFTVDEAENGKIAMQALKARDFSLVISDFEMPEMDGLQLFEFVKANSKARYLLLSEFSAALQARQAYQLGVDEFLKKPFSRENFMKSVDQAMTKDTSKPVSLVDFEYVQVPINEFVTGSVLKVDLYICISSTKYLKIANRGGTLGIDRIEGYLKKGVNWLYMRKQDFAYYVGFNMTLAQKVHSAEQIECSRKLRLTMHVTETLISQLKRSGLDRHQLEETSNVVMNAVELIASNPDTMKLLESMEVAGSLPAHSIATAIWSCLIAKQVGWTGQSTFFKIAICALFHDIGNKEIEEPVFGKARFEMSRQEVKVLEGHTIRGRDILQSLPGMLEDAIIVASQHHELYRGGGYPYGLKFQQIHPLARLIGLADRLCELLKYGGDEVGIEAAYAQLSLNSRDYDPDFFRGLAQLVSHHMTLKQQAPAA